MTWSGLTLPVDDNRIQNIVIDPSNPRVIYCAAYDTTVSDDTSVEHLGFARSPDGGTTWTQINDSLASLRLNFIYLDPGPSVLYATVWTSSGSLAYRSADSGASWASFASGATVQNLAQLQVSPHDSDVLVGRCWQGICSTRDGGITWTQAVTFSESSQGYADVAYTSNPNIVYASSKLLKVYKSTDGSETFFLTAGEIKTLIGH